MTERTYLSCAETAKLLRKALKTNFPGQKFSVRSKTYSGGASINVYWENGYSQTEVEKVAKMYAGAGFDGMIDLKYYNTNYITEEGQVLSGRSEGTTGSAGVRSPYEFEKPEGAREVHFGADFVFCNRTITKEIYEQVAQELARDTDIEYTDLNQRPREDNCGDNWYNIVWKLLRTANLTKFRNIQKTDCTCGQWPQDFFKVVC